jgi:hypothetical protein
MDTSGKIRDQGYSQLGRSNSRTRNLQKVRLAAIFQLRAVNTSTDAPKGIRKFRMMVEDE